MRIAMNTGTNTAIANRRLSPPRVADLYPLRFDRAVDDVLRQVLTPERDGEGRRIVRAKPDADQDRLLGERLGLLMQHMRAAPKGEIARAVLEMLTGFGSSRGSEQEAAAVVAQYVSVLQNMPLWAIRRACGRFARGEVQPDEIDGKLDKAFAPSTAQLHTIVEKTAAPFFEETSKIRDARGGVLEHKPDPVALQRMEVKAKRWLDRDDEKARELQAAVDRERAGRAERHARELREGNDRMILREYQRLGIEPRYLSDGRLISPTLATQLQPPPAGGEGEV
jgi:hypothetical protein